MEKLTISKSSWHYRFLNHYDVFKHKLINSYRYHDELYINNSCDYVSKLLRAFGGTILMMIATFGVAYTLVFDSILFYICASNLTEFSLKDAIGIFSLVSPSQIFEISLTIYLAFLILIVGCSIVILGAIVYLRVLKMKININHITKTKEPSALSKMIKAKQDKICIPIEIVESNK